MAFQFAGLYGPQAMLDQGGNPLADQNVTIYNTNSNVIANLFTDQTMSAPGTNPVTTDSYGNLEFYAVPGLYDLVVQVGGVQTLITVEVIPWFAEGGSGVPVGAIMMWAQPGGGPGRNVIPTPPAGWLGCSGGAVSRATYANLFGVIGTTFGAGDGSTTFNLPDMRSNFPMGADMGGGVLVGAMGGAASVLQTQFMMPYHNHQGATTNPNVQHNHASPSDGTVPGFIVKRGSSAVGLVTGGAQPAAVSGNSTAVENQPHTHTIPFSGGNPQAPTPTVPPYVVLFFIIKT